LYDGLDLLGALPPVTNRLGTTLGTYGG
jgi:hypothetical protein